MFPEELNKAVDTIVPPGITHVGFVPTSFDGMVLVAEPHLHPYGVTATFSKMRVGRGERPSEALSRCFGEQVGTDAASVYPIPSTWVTPNSIGYYFAGIIQNENDVMSSAKATLRWMTPEQARLKISESRNPTTRQRDLALLTAVGQMCLSPYRNVLLMLRELHLMGFERLRAFTYIYSLGTWRCEIVPAAWISSTTERHEESDHLYELRSLFEKTFKFETIGFYTSANGQAIFRSPESYFSSPKELASRFISERPATAAIGYGPDPEYAAWFNEVLEMLAPNGVFYSFAEYEEPTDHLYTSMSRQRQVPLPPPGQMDSIQWASFLARHKPAE